MRRSLVHITNKIPTNVRNTVEMHVKNILYSVQFNFCCRPAVCTSQDKFELLKLVHGTVYRTNRKLSIKMLKLNSLIACQMWASRPLKWQGGCVPRKKHTNFSIIHSIDFNFTLYAVSSVPNGYHNSPTIPTCLKALRRKMESRIPCLCPT